MRCVIVTGMSGAGKSTALKMLEDMGYFCVDNLPISLIGKIADLTDQPDNEVDKIALGIDIRSGHMLSDMDSVLDHLKAEGLPVEILYLDCADEELVKRYKETRRTHPLAREGRVDKGIRLEREQISFLNKKADYIIDTTKLLTRELKEELEKIFVQNGEFRNLVINIQSFGFKYGIPVDSDLVFDARFLPNPYYVEELKAKSGNDPEVQEFVMSHAEAREFLDRLTDLLHFLVPNYIKEGKNQLVISIGCTGGKHRSVTLANKLYEKLKELPDYSVTIEHRDIEKDARRKG